MAAAPHKAESADEAAARIARDILGLETLETRNSDSLDFHDLCVAQIEAALKAAYAAGAGTPSAQRGGAEMSLRFDTAMYRRSHGKAPRGWGAWAFFFDQEGVAWFAPRSASYTDAKVMAKAEAAKRGARVAHVAP